MKILITSLLMSPLAYIGVLIITSNQQLSGLVGGIVLLGSMVITIIRIVLEMIHITRKNKEMQKGGVIWVKRGSSYYQIFKDQIKDSDIVLSCKGGICRDGKIKFGSLSAYGGYEEDVK